MKVLVLNAGSSSQKSCLYELPEGELPEQPPHPVWEGKVDWTHHQGFAEIEIKIHGAQKFQEEIEVSSRAAVVAHLLETLWSGDTQVIEKSAEIDVVGHRVVHGGERYRQSAWITPEVKQAIADLFNFAPVHNPANLEGIVSVEQALGDVPQVAVFDTAFHAQLPQAASIYPIPYEWTEKGIRRYGFHGISHQYCAQRAAHLMGKDLESLRLIICHLGNGCSLSAVKGGHSVDTTMGFTPLEGLMMGTRSGSIDPGILIHWLRQEGFDADHLDRMLNKESGFLGISGISADMRQIDQAIAEGNPRALLAFEVYVHALRRFIGAMLPSLGGLDALVFTAGVGENSAPVRAATCQGFQFLGLEIDPEQNQQRSPKDFDIATPTSTARVFVIHTQEDWAIAQECWRLCHVQG